MGLKAVYKTDLKAVTEGVWWHMDHCKNKDGSIPAVLLARTGSGNPKYEKAYADHIVSLGDLTAMTEEDDRAHGVRFFVEFAVLGWDNIQPEDDGNNLPFNQANGVKLLSDPEWYDLLDAWKRRSASIVAYRTKQVDQLVKN